MSAICFCGPQSLTPVLHSVPRGWYPPKRPPLHHSKNVQGSCVNMITISVFQSSNRISSQNTNHKISTAGPQWWSFTHHFENNPWTFGWFRYILPLLKTTLRLGHPFFVSQALHQQCPVEQQHLNLHSLGLNKNTRIQESQKSVFLAPKFFVFLHKPRKNWIPWVHRSWVVEHLVLFGPFQPYFPDFFDPFQEPMLLSFAVCLLSILSYRSCPTPFSLVYQIKWFIYLFLGCVHKHTCSCPPKAKQERASSVSVNISLA